MNKYIVYRKDGKFVIEMPETDFVQSNNSERSEEVLNEVVEMMHAVDTKTNKTDIEEAFYVAYQLANYAVSEKYESVS